MKRITFLGIILLSQITWAQVGINNDASAPDTSAMLDIKSTSSGLLIPRMTAADRDNIGNPATGLTVFVTDNNSFYYYDGAQWVNLSTQPDEDWKVEGDNMYSLPTGNVGIGTSTPAVKLEINGDIRGNQNGALRINTGNGYVDVGPANTEWAHFLTDRSKFYFNKRVTVNEGIISSYDEDLQLATQQTTRLTISNDDGNVGIGIAPQTDAFVAAQSDQFNKIGSFSGTRTTNDDIGVYGDVSVTDWYGYGGLFKGGWIGVEGTVSPTGDHTYFGMVSSVNGGSGTNIGYYSSVTGSGEKYNFYGDNAIENDNGYIAYFNNNDDNGIALMANGSNTSTNYFLSSGSGITANGKLVAISAFSEEDDTDTTIIYASYEGDGNYADATALYGNSTPRDNWGYGVKGIGGYMGVYGEAINGFAGIFGKASGNTTYAIYADGDTGVSGTKSFVIDYPLDPENKYLKHFSIESNEVLNVYRGNVTLDNNGKAEVSLPEYFTAINKNFSYQLTPVGSPSPGIYIAKEINSSGKFVIAGGQPGQKISWYVYAERNDPYLQKYPKKRENIIIKNSKEKGKYLMPDLYNQPKEQGINYSNLKKSKIVKSKKIKKPVLINKKHN